ncbi:hypothetical protein Acr_13g0000120 [Actinidia rufa]|uniref:Mitochondrial protein n=1 Tax=Actinidia rufa TaxID=165716 RepID=A0A7J0FIV3_9ERIC|nr:hypothetical protein Acr_13g0000120 [Actinidia rufa]
MADPIKEVALIALGPVPVSFSHSQPAQRVMSVLLNGRNFHAWSCSFQFYLGEKRKTRRILGKEPKPDESDPKCMLMPAMSPESLSSIKISLMPLRLPWDSLLLIILDTSRLDGKNWPSTSLSVISPAMGLLSPSALIIGIHWMAMSEGIAFNHLFLCLSPLPLLQIRWPCCTFGDLNIFSFFGTAVAVGGCRGGGRGQGTPRTGAIVEMEPMHADLPNFNQLQTQIAQLQSHLGLIPSSSSDPMAAIVAGTPTALHGPPSSISLAVELFAEDGCVPPCPLLILESPPPRDPEFHSLPSHTGSLPSIVTIDPSQVYSRCPRSQDQLSTSSQEPALQNPLWVSTIKAAMDTLHHNRTWDLVALPAWEHTVGCKWVFSVKYLADGSVD